MQISNESSYKCFVFESLDERDKPIDVVVCRATYQISNNRLVLDSDQEPVVLADVYRNQPLTSSVKLDTDLLPKKYAADITFNSVAHAPDGKPASRWPISVRVGRVSKRLRVTGPRHWKHGLLQGWHLSSPEPATEVPIQYEYAFGGTFEHRDEQVTFQQNPVGRGFASVRSADPRTTIPAPQIEDPTDPITTLGTEYSPAGLGPIAKHWSPRSNLCGTADDQWVKDRWPLRPLDFDFHYYNCAPQGLVYPGFLYGDEAVLLTGLSPNGPIEFSLPSVSLTLFALSRSNEITLESMNLDTLYIDTTTMQVFLS